MKVIKEPDANSDLVTTERLSNAVEARFKICGKEHGLWGERLKNTLKSEENKSD